MQRKAKLPAPDWIKAEKPAKAERVKRVGWKAIQALKAGGTLPDHHVVGLRWKRVAWQTKRGPQSAVYGEWRFKHPVLGKTVSKSERVRTEAEIDDAMLAAGVPSYSLEEELDRIRSLASKERRLARNGIDPSASTSKPCTVERAFELQLEHCKTARRSPATVELYCAMHKHFADWASVDLHKLTAAMVRDRHAKIGKQSGTNTANQAIKVFRAAYRLAADEYRDRAEPLKDFPKVTYFKLEDYKSGLAKGVLPTWFRELAKVPEPRRSAYLVGICTGLRYEDLRCIQTKDVHLDEGFLHVPAPKGGVPYDVPLTDYLTKVIKRALPKAKHGYLWPTLVRGKQGPIGDLRPRPGEFSFKWVPHDMRRAFLSASAAAGVHPYLQKKLANHKTQDVTYGYISADIDTLRVEAEKVVAYLRELGLSPC